MRFELEIEHWNITIELEKTPNYKPDSKFTHVSQSEKKDWEEGKLSFYSMMIRSQTSDPDYVFQDPLIHYTCGVLLPDNQEEIIQDLEVILDEEGLLEHIFKHWELIENTEGPEWREPS